MVQRLAVALRSRGLPWLRDVVPALGGVALHFDPAFEGNVLELAAELAAQCLKKGLPAAKEFESEIELPVCYEAEFAPDMDEVSKKTGLAAGEVAKRHAAAEYRVLMIGFASGHAYLGGLDARLAVPRRATPRAQVPAGSAAPNSTAACRATARCCWRREHACRSAEQPAAHAPILPWRAGSTSRRCSAAAAPSCPAASAAWKDARCGAATCCRCRKTRRRCHRSASGR